MYYAAPLIFFSGLGHFVQIFWETMTLYSNYQGIRQNLTYNEMQNGNRYHYLKSPNGYNFNPFDRGNLVDNIKVWLNPPVDFKSYYFVTRDLML